MPPERYSTDRTERWLRLALTLIGYAMVPAILYLAIHQVGRPLWLDDAHSTHHAFLGEGGVIDNLRTDSHPPLYFAFLSAWIDLGGLGEAWLRLPSIVFTMVGGLVLFLYGLRAAGRNVAVMVTLFFLFHIVVAAHMHTVRPYALAGMWAALSTVLYMRLATADGPTPWPLWLAFVMVNALGTLTHYWFFFVMAGEGLGALVFARKRARRWIPVSLAAAAVPFAVFWGPVFMEQLQGSPTSWMPVPGGFWILRAPINLLGSAWPYSFPASSVLLFFAAVIAIRFLPLPKRARPAELWSGLRDPRLGLSLAIPLTVMLIAFAASQVRPVFHVRYVLVAIPGLAIFMALLLERIGDRRLVPLACLYFLFASVSHRDDTLSFDAPPPMWSDRVAPGETEGIRGVVRYLTENYREGDEIVSIALGYAPTKHYLVALSPDRTYEHRVFPREMERHVGWRNPAEIQEESEALAREAEGLVGTLSDEPDLGRVWFVPDFNQDLLLSNLLLGELEANLFLEEVVPLRGWGASEIRVYRRGSASTQRAARPDPASAQEIPGG